MLKLKSFISFERSALTAIALLFFIAIAMGQDKKSDALDKVKGKVQKITIQTDEGTVTYAGGEAQDLFDRLKSSRDFSRIRISEFDDDSEPEIMVFSPDKSGKNFRFFSDDMIVHNKTKIKVEYKNGERVVTVTTTDKDGNKKTETYKGKEAEEYLKKHDIKSKKWFEKSDDGNSIEIITIDKDKKEDKK